MKYVKPTSFFNELYKQPPPGQQNTSQWKTFDVLLPKKKIDASTDSSIK